MKLHDDREQAEMDRQEKNPTVQLGLIFRWDSTWIGWHRSPREKRHCVNILPCCTIWWTRRGGFAPVYRSWKQWEW